MMQVQDRSLFVDQVVDAMRPLIGFIESAEIRKFGLEQAGVIYDRLLPDRHLGANGVPHPGTVIKGQAVAEAFALACKRLNLLKFVDFSDMDFLLDQGHKDPAAIMCGSELEKHLRKLCTSNGINVFLPPSSAGEPRPKRAEQLNTELASINVYGKQEQKDVTAWLGLRNSAAHGNYHEYNGEQVSLMLRGVREFMTRFPA
jgi:hypothetical protein